MDTTKPIDIINNFGIIGTNVKGHNCTELSKLLYDAFLNKFQVDLQEESAAILSEYRDNIYDCVEYMREVSTTEIKAILETVNKENPYVADIILMSWSLPRHNECMSLRAYDRQYKKNIAAYNHKLIELIDCFVVKNFCYETLTKTNNVPVHCIDILWHYMFGISVEFVFCNDFDKTYVGIKINESDGAEVTDDTFTLFKINLEYVLDMGLGQFVGKTNGSNGSLKSFIRTLITNQDYADEMINCKSPSTNNFIKQVKKIGSDTKKYFGEEFAVVNFCS